jgi:hypothetical protein
MTKAEKVEANQRANEALKTVLTKDVLAGSCSTCARDRALCGFSEKVKCEIWTPSESKIADLLNEKS